MIISKEKLNKLVNVEPEKLVKAEENVLNMNINRIISAEYVETDVFLIAGPSGSGKTTFAKRLAKKLDAVLISLDDFYIDREKTPLDINGNRDYECPQALRIDDFQKTVLALLDGKAVGLPTYDFVSGTHTDSEPVELNGRKIVVEGLHALNPMIYGAFRNLTLCKIFIHADTTIIQKCHHSRVQRLLRRIARDVRERGRSVQETVDAAPSVDRGERIWIYPFKEDADYIFNTFTLYELPALAELLKDVDHPVIKTYLGEFKTLDLSLIPDNAICREFIGH